MKKDVVEAIDTAATTNDEWNRDRFLDFELDDTGGNGDGDEGPVIIRFQTYRYRYNNNKPKRVFVLPRERRLLKQKSNDRNSDENLTNQIKEKENKDSIQLIKFDQMTSQIICTYSYIKIDK